jgi:hypothetical protein
VSRAVGYEFDIACHNAKHAGLGARARRVIMFGNHVVQPLWELHAEAKKANRSPDPEAVAATRAKVDWRRVEIMRIIFPAFVLRVDIHEVASLELS